MKKFSYIGIFLATISCTSLVANETLTTNSNDVIEQTTPIKEGNKEKKALENQIRVRLSSVEKNDLDIFFSDKFSLNGELITDRNKINIKNIDGKVYIDNTAYDKVDIVNNGIMTINTNSKFC